MGRGTVEVVYDPVTGIFTRKGKPTGSRTSSGHLVIWYEGKLWLAHRLAFKLMGEPVPEIADHRNTVRDDNRWLNLRPASPAGNSQNRSKYGGNLKGAYFKRSAKAKPWYSKIMANGNLVRLGYFDTEEQAHAAYCKAADQLHGEFACHG